ncbi:MAG: metal-dependent transcriptional regulator [Eggerthellaceae bacterium]
MSEAKTMTVLESRSEALSHSLEDYLEAMVDLAEASGSSVRAVDVATKLGVSKASVSKAISNLRQRLCGTALLRRYNLDEKGRSYGEALWRRHNLLYRFLAEVIGIDQQTANYEACQMEHAISEDSFVKWEAYYPPSALSLGRHKTPVRRKPL